jgi:hypothetical protein
VCDFAKYGTGQESHVSAEHSSGYKGAPTILASGINFTPYARDEQLTAAADIELWQCPYRLSEMFGNSDVARKERH